MARRRKKNWFDRINAAVEPVGLGDLASIPGKAQKTVTVTQTDPSVYYSEAKSYAKQEMRFAAVVGFGVAGFAVYKPLEGLVEQVPFIQQYGPFATNGATLGIIWGISYLVLRNKPEWRSAILWGAVARIILSFLQDKLQTAGLSGYVDSQWESVPEKESA